MQKKLELSRLLSYAGRYRFLTYASWVLSALSAFVAILPFWCVWRLIGMILSEAGLHGLSDWGWRAVGFAASSMLIYIAGLMCSHLAAFRIAANVRIRLLRHIASLPLGVIERIGSGRLRRIIVETSGAAETYLAHQLPDKYGAIATALGLTSLLLSMDWRLGLLSLLPIALGFFILSRMTGQSMQRKMYEYQNSLETMSNEAVEYIRGIPVVKTFGQTIFSFKRFKEAIQSYEHWTIAYTKELRLPMISYTLAVNSIFIFLTAAGLIAARGGIDRGFLLKLILTIIVAPLISLTLTRTMRQSEQEMVTVDALNRIDEVLALSPLPEAAFPAHPMNASVELQNVTFCYGGIEPAISKMSFSVQAGQTVALVGPSGGGKTTLARLISRFFDPQEGTVLLGGIDIRNIAVNELMKNIAFVFQDSRLIKGSILDNVRMARTNASRGEVIRALEAAQCMDIIEKFPKGVDTIIGAGSVHLSGGEAQRIAVARAVLKDAPVIILDEATAFADPDNERRMQAALSELAKGKTVILIAHRLSTVTGVSKIVVLKDGRIAEQGGFEELIADNSSPTATPGLFKRMWEDYRQSVEWKVGARS
ncbi:MAG: ABC transporter ATP-binding protein [Fretibacterium sp.]|nr:ABC transporter ATP-binding protein [Fretibacterium sp.]